jgi:hypothetical protein
MRQEPNAEISQEKSIKETLAPTEKPLIQKANEEKTAFSKPIDQLLDDYKQSPIHEEVEGLALNTFGEFSPIENDIERALRKKPLEDFSSDQLLKFQLVKLKRTYLIEKRDCERFKIQQRKLPIIKVDSYKFKAINLILYNESKEFYEKLANQKDSDEYVDMSHYYGKHYVDLNDAQFRKTETALYFETEIFQSVAPKKFITTEEEYENAKNRNVYIWKRQFNTKLHSFIKEIVESYEKDGKDVFDNIKDVFDNIEAIKNFVKNIEKEHNMIEKTQLTSAGINTLMTQQISDSTPFLKEQPPYSPALQGIGTNKLAQLSTRRTPPTIDKITGRATITDGDFAVFIEKYNNLAGGFRVSTHKLFDALTIQFTNQNDYKGTGEANTIVSILLEKYMRRCGTPLTKTSKDKTRRNVKEDLEVLYNVSLEWKEHRGNKTNDYAKMRIISSQGIKNGQIIAGFSPEIAQYLTHAYVMQYPHALFLLDERNEIAYIVGRYLAVHASIDNNRAKKTSNIISVKSLLEACRTVIKSHDDVAKTDRHFERRIIKPLEKALDSLQEIGVIKNWHYCNSKKTPLTDPQLDTGDYKTFIKQYVYFEMENQPDQTPRLQAKALRTTKRRASKKKKNSNQ